MLEQKEFVYTKRTVDVLYDHMDDVARMLITERYAGKETTALLVDFNSVEHCMEVIGRESDPRKCAPHTLRALYGTLNEPECLGSWHWWENAIHRPIDERERVRDLKFIFPKP